MFDELHRNTKMLKEQEQQEAIQQEMQYKLQDKEGKKTSDAAEAPSHRKNKKGLQVMFDEVPPKNTAGTSNSRRHGEHIVRIFWFE